jgi:signal transduction histidine kinase
MEEGERLLTEMDVTFGAETRHHYREAIAPLRDTSGRILGIIGAATDITDQQRSQQQLTSELDFRERMMGILGHDLRNPLNVVILAADQLMRDQGLPPAAQKRLLRLRRSAARMHEMIETLLDFTRARFMGSVPVSPVPTDLGTIARTTVDDVRALWPDSAIGLEVRGDPRGEWDPARMTQTIGNLVTNAIAYGEKGGRVQVAVQAEGRDVELTVHNQGAAIPAEIIPVLFEPFRRGAAQDRSPGGLGLGLYIVGEIVKAHGGSIRVDSTDRDGTTFTLKLPRHPPKQEVH